MVGAPTGWMNQAPCHTLYLYSIQVPHSGATPRQLSHTQTATAHVIGGG